MIKTRRNTDRWAIATIAAFALSALNSYNNRRDLEQRIQDLANLAANQHQQILTTLATETDARRQADQHITDQILTLAAKLADSPPNQPQNRPTLPHHQPTPHTPHHSTPPKTTKSAVY